jgi:hypothetical protein
MRTLQQGQSGVALRLPPYQSKFVHGMTWHWARFVCKLVVVCLELMVYGAKFGFAFELILFLKHGLSG